MRSSILISLMLFAVLFSACAETKEIVKKEALGQPQAIEGVSLREALPESELEPRERPKHLEPVLIETDKQDEKFVLINFDNTDIQTVISTFGELLDLNYVLSPTVSGKVTIQSYKKFPAQNLFSVFQNVLELNGLTALEQSGFHLIVPLETAKQLASNVEQGKDLEFRLNSAFMTQLIPLEYVKATDVSSILTSLMPRGADIIVYEPSNLLIVTALPKTLRKFIKIIEAIDIPDSERESVKTFVYHVENGSAVKLEEILSTIYSDRKLSKESEGKNDNRDTESRLSSRTSSMQSLPGQIGEISITAYEDINALIIKCTPRTYLSLLEVMRRVDIPPKQVLIEVMVAEVTLTDSLELGLEWLIKTGSGDIVGLNLGSMTTGTATAVPPLIPSHPGGFAAVVSGSVSDDLFNYVFSALASKTDINVLASPLILAMDNQEAEIKIGSEVPTATSTSQSMEGATTSSEIEYKTVGTILTVNPRITEKGNVSMKIVVESSSVSQTATTIGTGTYPTFETRRATTSAVVQDGHTLFIGGLISDRKVKSRSGIPWLSRIPILGYLFGSTLRDTEKRELLVMVTPHVVTNQSEADELTREFKSRVKTVMKRFSKLNEKGEGKEKSPINGEDEAPDANE